MILVLRQGTLNKMADVNSVSVSGPVTWHQHWKPKNPTWGGTVAIRIALAPVMIREEAFSHTVANGEIFCKISYSEKQIGSKWLEYLLSQIKAPSTHVLLNDTKIAYSEKDGKFNYFLKSTLSNVKLDTNQAKSNENIVLLYGKCIKSHKKMIQIQTSYRYPKQVEPKYRYADVLCNYREPLEEGKWGFVRGALATKDPEGKPRIYVVAETII